MSNGEDRPMTGATWIVVASASHADIYARKKRFSALEVVHRLTEPDARAKERDLSSDAPGRSFNSHGSGRHAMEPDHTAREHLRGDFARRIAADVESGRAAGHFQHLMIVASPDMLGALRGHLSDAARRLVSLEISKDMTAMGPGAIGVEIDRLTS